MIRITVNSEPIDLFDGFSLEIEDTSPIFNDAGPQTLSFSIPATARNRRVFGFPSRPDSVANGAPRCFRCSVESGPYIRTGVINLTGASEQEISINIGFDNSLAYEAWRSKRLADLDSLPFRKFQSFAALFSWIRKIYAVEDPRIYDMAVFPICVDRDGEEDAYKPSDYMEVLTPDVLKDIDDKKTVTFVRKIDGVLTDVTAPVGYGCTPFVKVWKILECVFADLGLRLDSNPLFNDDDLVRLVVLNNTADVLCTGNIDYRELMPDCTVEEFLHSLFVRFGIVYRTDFDTNTAYVRMLRDIASMPPTMDIDGFLAEPPSSEFSTPRYVSLSAQTSITGAQPLNERFEDFLSGYSVSNVYIGEAVDTWIDRTPPDPGFGDDFEPFIDPADRPNTGDRNPDEGGHKGHDPDPDDHDPSPDEGLDERPVDLTAIGKHFIWDSLTGKWYRVSVYNDSRVKEGSSSFFIWNPNPEGFDAMELSSSDESCPVAILTEDGRVTPMFLAGARHFHSYIDSLGNEERGGCPLSFLFAVNGSSMDGAPVTVGRPSTDTAMLYFQFRGGLYDRYWRRFDLMLRNADRQVSAVCRMGKAVLRQVDVLKPIMFRGVPMLIDSVRATISDAVLSEAVLTLIPLVDSDSDPKEVPDFPHLSPVL